MTNDLAMIAFTRALNKLVEYFWGIKKLWCMYFTITSMTMDGGRTAVLLYF